MCGVINVELAPKKLETCEIDLFENLIILGMINLTAKAFDLRINKLIRHYFKLQFKHKLIHKRYFTRKKRLLFLNKIYTSKAEIKHTNTKAVVTVYSALWRFLSRLCKIQIPFSNWYKALPLGMKRKRVLNIAWVEKAQGVVKRLTTVLASANGSKDRAKLLKMQLPVHST
jgi:hypothetical protein